MGDRRHVEVLHLQQLRDRLHAILEGEHCAGSCVSESAGQERLVSGEVGFQLVSELETLVQLDLCFDVSRDHGLSQHVCEVLHQSGRVDTFDLATGELSERAETVEVALVTLDRDDVDCDAGGTRNLADALVELLRCGRVSFCAALVEGTEADICEAIGADDH